MITFTCTNMGDAPVLVEFDGEAIVLEPGACFETTQAPDLGARFLVVKDVRVLKPVLPG